jgi:methylmalonyl-CoA mutase cobalamin-binding domain/chain
MGQDGHDRGARVIASGFSDLGISSSFDFDLFIYFDFHF